MAQVARRLAARGRRMVGWDEVIDAGGPRDAVIMAWRKDVYMGRWAAELGHQHDGRERDPGAIVLAGVRSAFLCWSTTATPGSPWSTTAWRCTVAQAERCGVSRHSRRAVLEGRLSPLPVPIRSHSLGQSCANRELLSNVVD